MPSFAKRWTRFSLRVTTSEKSLQELSGPNVTMFYNCREYGSQIAAWENNEPLTFDTASTLYLGQAGPFLPGEFQVNFDYFLSHHSLQESYN